MGRRKLKRHEVWIEGYKNGDVHQTAVKYATIHARNFTGALRTLADMDETFARHFNSSDNTFWHCRIFDNEKDARVRYG